MEVNIEEDSGVLLLLKYIYCLSQPDPPCIHNHSYLD